MQLVRRRRYLAFALIATSLTLVSMLSGYQAPSEELSTDLAWRLSPIGLAVELLRGLPGELRLLESQKIFAAKFSFTFDYLRVFLKTCLLEAPFYIAAYRAFSWADRALALLVLNAATHPVVYFAIPFFITSYIKGLLVAELFAPALEAAVTLFILWRFRSWREGVAGALLMVAANLFSWQVGLFL